MREIKQSIYVVFLRALRTLLASFLSFIVVSGMFYGNVLQVCEGEVITAVFFALAAAVLGSVPLFIDPWHKLLLFDGTGLRVAYRKEEIASGDLYAAEDLISVTVRRSPLMRLFRCGYYTFTFASERQGLYLRDGDALQLGGCLPAAFLRQIKEITEKQPKKEGSNCKGRDFYVHPQWGNALVFGVKTLFWGAFWTLSLLPVAAGVFYSNGIRFAKFLPGVSFAVKMTVIGGGLLAAVLLISALSAAAYLVYLGVCNAAYRMSVEEGRFTLRRGRCVIRAASYRLSDLRAVGESRFLLSPVKGMTSLTLVFAEGKRRASVLCGGQPLSPSEREDILSFFPDFQAAECPTLALNRFAPYLTLFGVCALLPVLFFSILESPLFLWLLIPLSASVWMHRTHRSYAENRTCITAQFGIFSKKNLTVKKADVSAVSLSAGIVSRPFGLKNAEIWLKNTETALVLPGLKAEEGEKYGNFLKEPKSD